MCITNWKKSVGKGYVLYDSNYKTFGKSSDTQANSGSHLTWYLPQIKWLNLSFS